MKNHSKLIGPESFRSGLIKTYNYL